MYDLKLLGKSLEEFNKDVSMANLGGFGPHKKTKGDLQMKAVFRVGKIASKVTLDEVSSVPTGIEFEISDFIQENEISVDEIPELGKYLVTHSKEAREMLKLVRSELTQFATDFKAIFEGKVPTQTEQTVDYDSED